ncbi:MAG: DUF5683 domain-containing protein [Bacteroidota bacterium]
MKHERFILLFGILSCFLVCPQTAHAQQVLSAAFMRQDSSKAQSDTLALSAHKITAAPLEQKSGNTALLLSAILPGAGQFYAHRYYTIPLYWGLGTFFVAEWITCNNYYRKAKSDFSASVAADTLYHLGSSDLQRIRNNWQDTRDKYTIYLVLTYIANLLDAYVGATLYSFDVSDNLEGTTTLKIKIPIH